MLSLSGIPLSIMYCLISIRLIFPETVIGDFFMNYISEEDKGREIRMEVRNYFRLGGKRKEGFDNVCYVGLLCQGLIGFHPP